MSTAPIEEKDAPSAPLRGPSSQMLRSGLSELAPVGDSMALVRLDISKQRLQTLGSASGNDSILLQYRRLRHIYAADNELQDITMLNSFRELLSLNLQRNRLTELPLITMTRLQSLLADDNGVQQFPSTPQPALLALSLSRNLISHVGGEGPSATSSSSEDTSAKDASDGAAQPKLTAKTYPQLAFVDLSRNRIREAAGLVQLPALRVANLSRNQIDSVQWLGGSGVVSLDLSHNRLKDLAALSPLLQCAQLRVLSVEGNPLMEDFGDPDELVSELLQILPALTHINGRLVTREDREDALAVKKERELEAAERRREEDEERASSEYASGSAYSNEYDDYAD